MARKTPTRRARLQVEKLEFRRLLAADLQFDNARLLDTPNSLPDEVAAISQVGDRYDAVVERSVRRGEHDSVPARDTGALRGTSLGRSSQHELAATPNADRRPGDVTATQSRLRLLRWAEPTAVRSVSVYVSKQSLGILSVSRVAIRPVVVRNIHVFQFAKQPPTQYPSSSESRANIESMPRAEGESPVDNWPLTERPVESVTEGTRVSIPRTSPQGQGLTFLTSVSRGDADSLSPNLLGASEVTGFQSGGFIELSSDVADRTASTNSAIEPLQSQVFLLAGPQFDLASFDYWSDGDATEIESEDLIDLIELLGGDADADESDDEGIGDNPSDEMASLELADADQNPDATEQIFSAWSEETQQGMIELSPESVVDLIIEADASTMLQDLTLELDAVIGSVRTFEWGDAELEIEDNEVDSSEPVESRRPETESHEEPLSARAAILPLLAAAVRRRVQKVRFCRKRAASRRSVSS